VRIAILSEVMGENGQESRITIYTTNPCAYCARVKRLLDARGLSYDEVNLARDPDGRLELAGRTGMMTFPQVLVGGQLIGGFEATAAAARSGRLDELTGLQSP
jgi:glutaredoxin 3